MSVSIVVTGKFKNGKKRTCGLHKSSNTLIWEQEYADFQKRYSAEIGNCSLFTKLELGVLCSPRNSSTPIPTIFDNHIDYGVRDTAQLLIDIGAVVTNWNHFISRNPNY